MEGPNPKGSPKFWKCQQTWQRTRWDCAYLSIELLANGADPHFSSLPIFQLLIQFFLHNFTQNCMNVLFTWPTLCICPTTWQFPKIHNVRIRRTKDFFLNTWRLMTSRRVAGALETRWIQIWSPCVHCLQTQHWRIIKLHENPKQLCTWWQKNCILKCLMSLPGR